MFQLNEFQTLIRVEIPYKIFFNGLIPLILRFLESQILDQIRGREYRNTGTVSGNVRDSVSNG